MPLTSKGREIKHHMEETYGEKKGEEVFYASANKGTITGVHDEEIFSPAISSMSMADASDYFSQGSRSHDSQRLAELNRVNRDRFSAPPLPARSPSGDGRSAGGLIDERFRRR